MEHSKDSKGLETKSPSPAKDYAAMRQPDPGQELSYRLKSAIDQNGRYKYRLGDMVAGFAVGKEVPNEVARDSIEKKFSDQFGMTPHEYLERSFERRRQRGVERGMNGSRSRGDFDRER